MKHEIMDDSGSLWLGLWWLVDWEAEFVDKRPSVCLLGDMCRLTLSSSILAAKHDIQATSVRPRHNSKVV